MFQLLGRAAGAAGAVLEKRQAAADASALLDKQLTARDKRERNIRELDVTTRQAGKDEQRAYEEAREIKREKREEKKLHENSLSVAKVNLPSDLYQTATLLDPKELASLIKLHDTNKYHGSFQDMFVQSLEVVSSGEPPRLNLSNSWIATNRINGGTLENKLLMLEIQLGKTKNSTKRSEIENTITLVNKQIAKRDDKIVEGEDDSFKSERLAVSHVTTTLAAAEKNAFKARHLTASGEGLDPTQFSLRLVQQTTGTDANAFDEVGRNMIKRQQEKSRAVNLMTQGNMYTSTTDAQSRYTTSFRRQVNANIAKVGGDSLDTIVEINKYYAMATDNIEKGSANTLGEKQQLDLFKNSYDLHIANAKRLFANPTISPVVYMPSKNNAGRDLKSLILEHNNAVENGTAGFLTLDGPLKMFDTTSDKGKLRPQIIEFTLSNSNPGFKTEIWGDSNATVTQNSEGLISWQ